jgi:hypothetical protein
MNFTKSLASVVLAGIRPEILSNMAADGSYSADKVVSVEDAIGDMRRIIESTDLPPNPKYHVMGDLVAELLLFSFNHPEHFSEIFDDSEIEWTKNIDICTADGLFKMHSLVRALGDDHSFALDQSGAVPKLVGDWQLGPKTTLVSPEELFVALARYRLSVQTSLKQPPGETPSPGA